MWPGCNYLGNPPGEKCTVLWDQNCVWFVESEIFMYFVGSNLYVLFEEREREIERRRRRIWICSRVWKFATANCWKERGNFRSALETVCGSFALQPNRWKEDSLRICSQLQCGSLQRQIVEDTEREREREKQEDLQHLSASHKAGTRKIWLLDQLACIYSFGTRLCILAYTLQNDLAPTFAVGVGSCISTWVSTRELCRCKDVKLKNIFNSRKLTELCNSSWQDLHAWSAAPHHCFKCSTWL
jgi:hypothetical protein